MFVPVFIFYFKCYNKIMFSNPEKNINQLGVGEGMKVADFGAGTGFYVKILSDRVGNTGHVYAIEVQKELVKKLEQEVLLWGKTNVSVIWGDIERIEGTKIASKSLDVVIVSNVLFQVEDKIGLIDEIKRVLKKEGRLLLVDFNKTGGMYINKEEALNLFGKNGLSFSSEIDVSTSHYGLIFKL